MASTEQHPFRVLIAGGGIAGLALANALQQANIDYLLLEARDEIAPKVGASICMWANGSRILDQLGVLDDLLKVSEPGTIVQSWKDGFPVEDNHHAKLLAARHGYPFICIERRQILGILYDHLSDRSKILTGKRISRVDHFDDRVSVQCKDGSFYSGDIIIGADGVHSLTRQEMWRHANLAAPGTIGGDQYDLLKSEYRCAWAMSNPIPQLKAGGIYKTFGKDTSFLILTGKDNIAYWFVIDKMDKEYRVPNIPKFTNTDCEKLIKKHLDAQLTGDVTLRDLWERRISYSLLPLEEALFEKWTWGRFACVGDSIHKMTPNIGQGGNNAIESAAAISNALHRLLKEKSSSSKPALDEIERALTSYQDHREERIKKIVTIANKVTRLEALKGPVEHFMSLYFIPQTGDMFPNRYSASVVTGERLGFLPEPPRSLKATMPFNPKHGRGPLDKLSVRVLMAVPLLIVAWFASYVGFSSHGLLERQPSTLLSTLLPIYLTWTLESHRRANQFTFAYLPLIFGLALSRYNISAVVAAYFFLHYVQSAPSNFAAPDQRMINTATARTAFAAVAAATAISHVIGPSWPSSFPILVSAIHYILKKYQPDTTVHDILHNLTADLPALRLTMGSAAIISALAFNYTRFSTSTLFSPGDLSLIPLSALIWIALLIVDLKIIRITNARWWVLIALAVVGAVIAGPTATVCAAWWSREEKLRAARKTFV